MTKKIEYIIGFIWLFLVIPLIFFSYGSDPDSGRLAEAATKIWEYKEYFRSRTGGHPLYEIMISPLVVTGQWYLSNLLSVYFGFSILLALIYLSRNEEFNYPLLVILSIAFAPVFIKNATSTMDYMSALAFLTWSYVLMRQNKYFYAAILIGLAAGCRPISGLMVIPLVIYAWSNGKSWYDLLKIYLLAVVVGLIVYLPLLLTYGIPGSSYMPGELKMIILRGGYYFLSFFGLIASLIIFPSLIYVFYSSRKDFSSFKLFHFSNILIWFILFSYMPYEPEYLLPSLLSIILLFDKYLNYKVFLLSTILILSYHVIKIEMMAGSSGERYVKPSIDEGYTIEEAKHRVFQKSLREVATNFNVDQPTILYFGDAFIQIANDRWYYDEKLKLYKQRNGLLYIHRGHITCEEHKKYYKSGFTNIIWNDTKFGRATCKDETKYYKIIYNLNDYFNTHINGKLITSE